MFMEFSDDKTHRICSNWESEQEPSVIIQKLSKGEGKTIVPRENEIYFLLEGCLSIYEQGYADYATEVYQGQILFLAACNEYFYRVLADVRLLIFRLKEPVMLCESLPLEKLFTLADKDLKTVQNGPHPFYPLSINPRIMHLLKGITEMIDEGIRCKAWSKLKIRECLFMFRFYYRKEELHHFFYPVLSADTLFSEYVRLHWKHFRSVREMALAMNLSTKQFTSQFTAVFGQTPYQWMLDRRAGLIHKEITSTSKLFKQIAIEYGFSSDTQFTRFCKNELGGTPTEIRDKKKYILQWNEL